MPDHTSSHVSDSTDWLPTALPSFSVLDSALRCQVCKDFYDTPMITSCAHTFCSLCIRRCLSSDGKCPTCRAGDQASKLRRNWTVEEIVHAFKDSREAAIGLAQRETEVRGGLQAQGQRMKRKVVDAELDDPQPVRRSTRARRQANSQEMEAGTAAEPIVMDSEAETEEDYGPEPPVSAKDGLVPCPVCGRRMKEEAVFSHLDKCPGPTDIEGTRKGSINIIPASRSFMSQTKPPTPPPPARLPQLNYSLLRENALRKKLQELGIPSWGPKQLLERRHKEWVDLFNSNCDSTHPKAMRALLRDLDIWERSQGGNAPGANGLVGNGQQTQVMRKDFDTEDWKGRHKGQFDDLIAQAKAKARSLAGKNESTSTHRQDEDEPSTALMDTNVPSAHKQDLEAEDMSPPSPTLLENQQNRHASPDITNSSPAEDPSLPAANLPSRLAKPAPGSSKPSPAASIWTAAADSIGSKGDSHHPTGDEPSNQKPALQPLDAAVAPPHYESNSSSPRNAKTRKVPMFQMPEEPVDADGMVSK